MANEIAENSEKTRVAKSAHLVLLFVLTDRYSTAAIGCKFKVIHKTEPNQKSFCFSAILVLFLNLKIGYDKNTSTAIFHSYVFLAYLLPLLGSIIADSWWGQFKTLVWMALVFTTGAMTIAIATIDELHLPIA